MNPPNRSPASARYLRAANAARNQQAPVAQRATPGNPSNSIAVLIVIAAVAVAGATFLFLL